MPETLASPSPSVDSVPATPLSAHTPKKGDVRKLSLDDLPPESRSIAEEVAQDNEIRALTQKTIDIQLNTWSSAGGADGSQCLQNVGELKQNYKYEIFDFGKLRIYAPDTLANRAHEIAAEVDSMIGVITPGKTKADLTTKFHLTLVPENKFCPRGGFAHVETYQSLVDASSPHWLNTFRHEFTHSYMKLLNSKDGRNGNSFSVLASEGAAMGFSYLRDRKNPLNLPLNMWQKPVVLQAMSNPNVMGSHTQMLENAGADLSKMPETQTFEYSYIYGNLLFQYMINKFGQKDGVELFHLFYDKTCDYNQVSQRTGERLVVQGYPYLDASGKKKDGYEREIAWRSLHYVSLELNSRGIQMNADQLLADLQTFIKKYFDQRPKRPSEWLIDKLQNVGRIRKTMLDAFTGKVQDAKDFLSNYF